MAEETLPSVSEEKRALYRATIERHKKLEEARQRGIFERDQGEKDAKRIEAEVLERFGMSIDEVPDFIRKAVPENEREIQRFADEVSEAERLIEQINAKRAAA